MHNVDLGTCCKDCFDAVNFTPREVFDPTRMLAAGKKLSDLAEKEQVQSLHTGGLSGFTWEPCLCCGNVDAGMRWKLKGLAERIYA